MMMAFCIGAALLGIFLLLAIPFILVGLVLGTALFILGQILLLPLRLMGWTIASGAGVITFMVKLFLLMLIGTFCLIGLLIGFLPLLPIALVCLGVWLFLRSGRSRGKRAAIT